MPSGILLHLFFWVGYIKKLGAIQPNKIFLSYTKRIKYLKNIYLKIYYLKENPPVEVIGDFNFYMFTYLF